MRAAVGRRGDAELRQHVEQLAALVQVVAVVAADDLCRLGQQADPVHAAHVEPGHLERLHLSQRRVGKPGRVTVGVVERGELRPARGEITEVDGVPEFPAIRQDDQRTAQDKLGAVEPVFKVNVEGCCSQSAARHQ